MGIKYLGTVSTEGEPLLLINEELISNWNGEERYDEVLKLNNNDISLIDVHSGIAGLWNVEGPCILSVFKKAKDEFYLVHSWGEIEDEDLILTDYNFVLESKIKTFDKAKKIYIKKFLILLSSLEDGGIYQSIENPSEGEILSEEMVIPGQGFILEVIEGEYLIRKKECSHNDSEAEICIIKRIN